MGLPPRPPDCPPVCHDEDWRDRPDWSTLTLVGIPALLALVLALVLALLVFSCEPTPAGATTQSSYTPTQIRQGTASWYSTEACRYNPDPRCPTASGLSLYDLEHCGVLFAASNDYPLGTRLRVSLAPQSASAIRAQTAKRTVVVTVLDRGPAMRLSRVLDLSKVAFAQLAPLSQGLCSVTIEEIQP